jgi:hypothetical protein
MLFANLRRRLREKAEDRNLQEWLENTAQAHLRTGLKIPLPVLARYLKLNVDSTRTLLTTWSEAGRIPKVESKNKVTPLELARLYTDVEEQRGQLGVETTGHSRLASVLIRYTVNVAKLPSDTLEQLLEVDPIDTYAAYWELLQDIHKRNLHKIVDASDVVKSAVDKLFHQMVQGKLVCNTYKEFRQHWNAEVFSRLRSWEWTVGMTEMDVKHIDEALQKLRPKERLVLQHRYGIHTQKLTLEEVGALPEVNVSKERVREIQVKALRKLRLSRLRELFADIVKPLGERFQEAYKAWQVEKDKTHELEQELYNLKMEIEESQFVKELRKELNLLKAPYRSVDGLELTVRAYNCIKNAGFTTVMDLALKTESELLATKNFTKTTVGEVKELLEGMGLQFGMKLNEKGQLVRAEQDSITS